MILLALATLFMAYVVFPLAILIGACKLIKAILG